MKSMKELYEEIMFDMEDAIKVSLSQDQYSIGVLEIDTVDAILKKHFGIE